MKFQRMQHKLQWPFGDKSNPASMAPASSPERRTSKRERTSTLTWIDGHAVLRQNNYVVRGGEYVRGEEGEKAPPTQRVIKKARADSKPRSKPQMSTHELARQQHNEHVRSLVQSKEPLKWTFLAKHQDLLQHFCEPQVLQELHQNLPPSPVSYQHVKVQAAPNAIQATLRKYQMEGLEFMVNMHRQNLPMILGDEMGLGKTLQTISLLTWLKENQGAHGPSLVICPLSVLSSWSKELKHWAPALKVFRLHASNTEDQLQQKHELATNATNYDVIVTTYEMAKVPALKSLYARLHFHYLVLDEGHKIKGHLTLIAQAVRGIHCGNKLLLTGTPLQNNMVELWSLLNFLYPTIFTTSKPFEDAFNLTENIIDKAFLQKAQKLLDLFMLRRLKSRVETFIPPKLETKVYCPLSNTQSFWYKSLLMKDLGTLANAEKASQAPLGGPQLSQLRSLFMQLRKCCNHPFVFEGAELDPSATTLEELVAASGKLSVLDMLLQRLFVKKHRAVLFSQFTTVLDILEDYCILRGWKYCRLDGSTDRARRNYYIRRFNETDSPYFLFLVSTRSGGMGLNLQTADTCILYDSDWNPQSDIQAMGRVHRIGQTKTVHVYRLVSSGTIEERMLQRAEKKLLLEMVNQESHNNDNDSEDDKVRGLSAAELLEDIKFGSQAIFGNTSNNELPSWDDIDVITNRERKESDSIGKLQGNAMQTAKDFDTKQAFSETLQFGGKDFKTIRDEQKKKLKSETPKNLRGISHLWQEISQLNQKRQRKNRILMVEGGGTGYGSAVPVLKSNNYELETGETSVFDRELSKDNKAKFGVKKKKNVAQHENQDFCQVCGDGGSLVCCSLCPCSVHLECVGLKRAKDFSKCTHHNCALCHKNRASAGGLLYPCHACQSSYCEDCLPQHGVTFLDRVERFDELNFDSSKANVVYILCSGHCTKVARKEFGYKPEVSKRASQLASKPRPLDISFAFGGTSTLEKQIAELQETKDSETNTAPGRRTRRGSTFSAVLPPSQGAASKSQPHKIENCEAYLRWKEQDVDERAIEKVSLHSGEVVGVYPDFKEAAKTIGVCSGTLYTKLRANSPCNYGGYVWQLLNLSSTDPVAISESSSDSALSSLSNDIPEEAVQSTTKSNATGGSGSSPMAIDEHQSGTASSPIAVDGEDTGGPITSLDTRRANVITPAIIQPTK